MNSNTEILSTEDLIYQNLAPQKKAKKNHIPSTTRIPVLEANSGLVYGIIIVKVAIDFEGYCQLRLPPRREFWN